jgi:protein-disulfide isomerase
MRAALRRAVLLCLPLTLAAAAAHATKVGDPAPAFTLTDTNGKQHALGDFKGKVVVLEWFNHDCPFVKKHYDSGNMPALQSRYTAKDVVWLSINSSAPGKQGNYTPEQANELSKEKKSGATYVLLDPDGKVGREYGAKTTPHMYVIDGKGVLRYEGAIDSVSSTDQADIKDATNYVASAVDAVMAGKAVDPSVTQSYGCAVKY